jgi:sulfur carrier protein
VKAPIQPSERGANLKPYSLDTFGWSLWIRFFLVTVKIKINGEEKEFADGLSVAGLLGHLQIRPGRVVVELNREIVSRDAFGGTMLAEGDTLEIVHFVGGG